MGMTNRAIPAQGEERGASFTLKNRDGGHGLKVPAPAYQFQISIEIKSELYFFSCHVLRIFSAHSL
jgi:hypothetical protein